MGINREKAHLTILTEDRVTQSIANGFDLQCDGDQIEILPYMNGWTDVRDSFTKEQIPKMERYSKRFVVLLVDFDNYKNRAETISRSIPEHLQRRVFVLGVSSNPEKLRRELNLKIERIGETLAHECREGRRETWNHSLLKHNRSELERMPPEINQILFPRE